MDMMTAAFFQTYGTSDVMEVGKLPLPQPVGADEVRISVHSAGLNPRDTLLRSGFAAYTELIRYLGRSVAGNIFPKVTGSDYSGRILEVGRSVLGLAVGDEVFGYIQHTKSGSAAEQIVVKASWVARKPASLSHPLAASLPCVYMTALQGLRDQAKMRSGQRLLVYGASGGVGTATLQLARHLGAEVTAVSSSRNAAYCEAQGAHHVLCYDKQDVWAQRQHYDVFFQIYGHETLYDQAQPLLKPHGTFMCLLPLPSVFIKSFILKVTGGPQLKIVQVKVRRSDLEEIGHLAVERVLQPEVKSLGLSEVKNAHEQIDTGHTRGKIVLSII